MKKFDLNEAAAAVGGVADQNATVSGVFTDSRKPLNHGLFVALTGDRFNGHDFIPSLEKSGIAAVLVEKDISTTLPKLLVKDTRLALGALARYHRARFDIPVVGLTGSVGKTTTKEMIHCVLSAKFNTLKTEGNLNNDIGMPLTLLRLDPCHTAAVIEMGMNHAGEISGLTAICRPTVAVITNIGMNHIENLGSQENIFRAKLEILEGLQPGAPLILNGDDKYLGAYKNENYNIIRYGMGDDTFDFTATDVVSDAAGCSFVLRHGDERANVRLHVPGAHNVSNALAAAAVGSVHGIALADIAAALENYAPAGMRQHIAKYNNITVIEDCYNAAPASVKAALQVLSGFRDGKRIAVLGDMLELGDYAEALHREVGAAVKGNADLLLTYGALSKFTADAAAEGGVPVLAFTDKTALATQLRQTVAAGDAVLVKGSRGMRMETIIADVFGKQDV
ncbi:MAG: UDP-N-acetylmuramoyl-tripeptide--D-alanyl-D-alanine ligase [Clostridia bacterium]|nr:UDP-N-acetylmuramoyl-tripeptide--D-alanyl-D-alanine ligase [Clostridia bacterium]